MATEQPTKVYHLEFLEGDQIYVGSEIPAKTEEQAIEIARFMFGTKLSKDSELILIEQATSH